MITSIIAAILGVFYFYLSVFVIKTRRRLKISLGDGNNPQMLKAMSAHSNFQAYTPFLLILLFLLENTAALPNSFITVLGLMIFIGRLLHFKGIVSDIIKFRVSGMLFTLLTLMILSLVLIYAQFFQ